MLYRFELCSHDVKLGVRDQEDTAIHFACAGGLPLYLQQDALIGLHKPRATAMHCLVFNGVQVVSEG